MNHHDEVPYDDLTIEELEAIHGTLPTIPDTVPDDWVAEQNARELDLGAGFQIVKATEFVSEEEDAPPALVGDNEKDNVLPAGGLLFLVAPPATGKTTLTLDFIAHAASGTPWLDYDIPRPLRILTIQNESSRALYRRKLANKVESWASEPFIDNVHVYRDLWANFNFGIEDHRVRLKAYCVEHQIDLVIGDPLSSLGVEGDGKPSETVAFVTWLKQLGLGTDLAFWFCHHPNKDHHMKGGDKMQGSWNQHPDTVIFLEPGDTHGETKMIWQKGRWTSIPIGTQTILKWAIATEGYDVIAQAGATPETIENRIATDVLELLRENPEGMAKRDIRAAVKGKTEMIGEVIDDLVAGDVVLHDIKTKKYLLTELVVEGKTDEPAATHDPQMALEPDPE